VMETAVPEITLNSI